VLRRDNYTCRYCRSTTNPLHVDHVVPIALGGSDKPDNLVAACIDCNIGKAFSAPDEGVIADVEEVALICAQAMKVALAQEALKIADQLAYEQSFLENWGRWKSTDTGDPLPLPEGWRASLERWNDLGVTSEMITYAIDGAMSKQGMTADARFKYAAGVVWRTLDQAQVEAERAIGSRSGWWWWRRSATHAGAEWLAVPICSRSRLATLAGVADLAVTSRVSKPTAQSTRLGGFRLSTGRNRCPQGRNTSMCFLLMSALRGPTQRPEGGPDRRVLTYVPHRRSRANFPPRHGSRLEPVPGAG
jgi:hypothetical protein